MKEFVFCLLVAGCLCLFPVFSQAAPDMPADGLKMSYTPKTVVFNHSTHKDLECVTCHHQVEGKDNFAKCGSAGCHDVFDRASADAKGIKGYYRIMHEKRPMKQDSCMACHVKVVKEKPEMKKELTGCAKSKCHP